MEIGDLDNIEFKVKGLKTFVEKYLVFQDPQKYSMVSVKYQNQIVTTLNPYFKENDSILKAGNKELAKAPVLAAVKKPEILPKTAEAKKTKTTSVKPKEKIKPKATTQPKETKKTEKKPAGTKPKAKVKIE